MHEPELRALRGLVLNLFLTYLKGIEYIRYSFPSDFV